MKLYRSMRQEVPTDYYTVPIGQAATVREGQDLTVFAYGAMVPVAVQAAEKVEAEQAVSIEVIDLRTISPMDEAAIADSVNKTGRAIVVHEAARRTGGIGAGDHRGD